MMTETLRQIEELAGDAAQDAALDEVDCLIMGEKRLLVYSLVKVKPAHAMSTVERKRRWDIKTHPMKYR